MASEIQKSVSFANPRNLKIKYISFKKNDYNKLKGNISNLKFINYEEFNSYNTQRLTTKQLISLLASIGYK